MAKKLVVDLPEGLLDQILVRLPVESLLLCKLVCKKWVCTISSPNFIQDHLQRAIISNSRIYPTLLTILKPSPNVRRLEVLQGRLQDETLNGSIIYLENNNQQQWERYCQLLNEALLDTNAQDLSTSLVHINRIVSPCLFKFCHVVGSCNGIICLADLWNIPIYLWNPSISKFKIIPTPPIYKTRPTRPKFKKIVFGYDSFTNDYKVIRFTFVDFKPVGQVYSANTDCWREFPAPFMQNWTEDMMETYNVVNGVLYFDVGNELLTFDMRTEFLGVVPFPPFTQGTRSDVMDFQGSVAIVFESGSGFDLWTLDDASQVVPHWKKRLISIFDTDTETKLWLSEYLGAGLFYGCMSLGDDYFLYDILYNYENREIKYLGLGEEYQILEILKYTQTLVSLAGFRQVE